MGYEVHLVKRGNWFDDDSAFSQAEWEALCQAHGLANLAYFGDGRISIKNPSHEQVVKLVAVASSQGWSVQGDDGEVYKEDGSLVVRTRRKSFLDRLRRLLQNAVASKQIRESMAGVAPPFQVGERVRSILGKMGGVVIEVDPNGNHGAGKITVRFPDGSLESTFFIAHGFEKE